MILSEYVNNRLTRWDKFKLKFFWTPAVMLVVFIMIGLIFGDPTYEQGRLFLIIWIPTAAIAVVFHQSATKKVNRLKEEWEQYQ